MSTRSKGIVSGTLHMHQLMLLPFAATVLCCAGLQDLPPSPPEDLWEPAEIDRVDRLEDQQAVAVAAGPNVSCCITAEVSMAYRLFSRGGGAWGGGEVLWPAIWQAG